MKPLEIGATLGVAEDANSSFAKLAALGLTTAQIGVDPYRDAAEVAKAAKDNGIEITSVIAGFAGESYADIATVARTVGLVPLATREERTERFLKLAEFAKELGVAQVQTHIGFVPEEETDPLYGPLVEHTRAICDKLAESDQIFALETGQETAGALKRFLTDVGRPNLRVNFDPANMIMYGNDKPLDALEVLYPYIVSFHIKDGVWPEEEGKLGHETPFGEGLVDFPTFLPRLIELGFRGSLTIEREISGEAQRLDMIRAKEGIEEIIKPYVS
jgi:L-ribulose-5-phosphate 3-epimerase